MQELEKVWDCSDEHQQFEGRGGGRATEGGQEGAAKWAEGNPESRAQGSQEKNVLQEGRKDHLCPILLNA